MKFSIRELLLVTVIVALAVGWWVEHRRIAILERERDEVVNDAKFFAKHGSFRQSVGINGYDAAIAHRLLEKYKVDRTYVTRREAMRREYIMKLKDALRNSLGLDPSDELPPELEDEYAMGDAAVKVPNSSAPAPNPSKP